MADAAAGDASAVGGKPSWADIAGTVPVDIALPGAGSGNASAHARAASSIPERQVTMPKKALRGLQAQPSSAGTRIKGVVRGSPCAAAGTGLKAGDVIVRVGDVEVLNGSYEEVIEALKNSGETVSMVVCDGDVLDASLNAADSSVLDSTLDASGLNDSQQQESAMEKIAVKLPLGVYTTKGTSGTGEYRMYIDKVDDEDGNGAKAGLRPGHRVLYVNDQPMSETWKETLKGGTADQVLIVQMDHQGWQSFMSVSPTRRAAAITSETLGTVDTGEAVSAPPGFIIHDADAWASLSTKTSKEEEAKAQAEADAKQAAEAKAKEESRQKAEQDWYDSFNTVWRTVLISAAIIKFVK